MPRKLSLESTSVDPGRSGIEGTLYVKDTNGVGELYFQDTTGRVVKLTNLGTVNATILGGGGSGVTDHGLLTGLGDDDHSQYPLAASAETISGDWTFTGIVKLSKEYAAGTLPAASTLQDAVVKEVDANGLRMLRWSAYNGSTWGWVTLGVAQ